MSHTSAPPPSCMFLDCDTFGTRYQRNNKKHGLKNLRCFPTCADVHRERGFCGRPVRFQLDIGNADKKGIVVVSEFSSTDELPSSAVKLGQLVDASTFPLLFRDDQNPKRPWIEGIVTSRTESSTIYTFNQAKKGWHYGWASNKHSCNSEHTLQAYVMEYAPNSSTHLIVRAILSSPSFMIFCRRRRRFALTPSAPIAPPKRPRVSQKASAAAAATTTTNGNEPPIPPTSSLPDDSPTSTTKRRAATTSDTSPRAKPKSRSDTVKTDEPTKSRTKRSRVDATTTSSSSSQNHAQQTARFEATLRAVAKHLAEVKPPAMTTTVSSPSSGSMPEDSLQTGMNFMTLSTDLSNVLEFFGDIDGGDDDTWNLPESAESSSAVGSVTATTTTTATTSTCTFDHDLSSKLSKDSIISNLAQFLLEENQFTDAIHSLAMTATTDEKQDDQQLSGFVTILKAIVASFLNAQGISEAEFDEVLGVRSAPTTTTTNTPSATPTTNNLEAQLGMSSRLFGGGTRGAFRHIVQEAASSITGMFSSPPLASKQAEASPPSSFHSGPFSGLWDLVDVDLTSQAKLEKIREELGEPWLLRKMLGAMERSFAIEQDSKECRVRLRKKLFSSGLMTLVLDGEQRPWGMSLPMFQGLTKCWKYRAWYDEDRIEINHIHEVSETGRIVRKLSLNMPLNTRLTIKSEFEQWNGMEWVKKMDTCQVAMRVYGTSSSSSPSLSSSMLLDGERTPRSVFSSDDFFFMPSSSMNQQDNHSVTMVPSQFVDLDSLVPVPSPEAFDGDD